MAKRVGRPRKFKSARDLERKIEAYFDKCDQEGDPHTITGLALALDTSRRVLCEYERDPEFSNAIKRAKGRCEHWIERNALMGKINPTFAIFALKNYGWSDRQQFEHSGGVSAKIIRVPAKAPSAKAWEAMRKDYS